MEQTPTTKAPEQSLSDDLAQLPSAKKSKKIAFQRAQPVDCEENGVLQLVACDTIKAGEVILEEKPVLSAPLAEYLDKVCHVCMKESTNVQRCSGCKYAHYCGQDHQVSDWTSSHKKECSYFKQVSEKFPQKPLHHLLVLTIKCVAKIQDLQDTEFKRLLECLPLPINPSKSNTEVCSKIAETLLKLDGNKIKLEESVLIGYISRIILNSNLLKGKKNMDDWIACGIFPTTKLLKHSCSPNSFSATNPGLSHRSVAARQIEKGETITLSYVDLDQDVKWRKIQLLDNFSIECNCSRCTSELNDPTMLTSPFLANKGYYTAPTSLVEIEKYINDCKEHLPEHNYAWLRAFDITTDALKKLSQHEYYYGLLQFMLPKYEQIFKQNRTNPILGALYHKAAVLANRFGESSEAFSYSKTALALLEPYFTEKHVLELKVIIKHHHS